MNNEISVRNKLKPTEKKWRDSIRDMARKNGWKDYITQFSFKSPAGFPDLVLCHPELKRLVFAELKLDGKEPTEKQREWLQALAKVEGVEVYLIHLPSELSLLVEVLTGLRVEEF